MKQSLKCITLSLILLSPLSCNQKSAVKEPDNLLAESPLEVKALPDATAEVSQDTTQGELIRKCTAYWDELEKLHGASTAYFNTAFLPKVLATPGLSQENRKFLLALQEYINQPEDKINTSLAIEHPLLPIFKLKENELGIIGFPQHDYNNPNYTDISLEYKLITTSKLANKSYAQSKEAFVTQSEFVLHPELADSIFKNTDRAIFAFTTQGKVKTTIKNFGSYIGECSTYYNYLLNSQPFTNNDKVLFGSRYNLDLVYNRDLAIDAMLKSQYLEECQDCPNSGALNKTFATLKGVEGLYFTYADTFPLNNKLDTPLRALAMNMNGKAVYLWYAEVDLVGCSCI